MNLILLNILLLPTLVLAQVTFPVTSTTGPSAPSNGTINLGRKTDGFWYEKSKSGAESPLKVDPKANTLVGYQTISGLRASSLSPSRAPSTIIITDLGKEGTFLLKTGSRVADNGGTVLVTASGLHYERIHDNYINVHWFGAKGDAVNDDKNAIQAAANEAGVRNAVLYFPAGTYKITGQVTLKNTSRGIDMSNSAYISPIGSGYTALVTEKSFVWNICRIKIVGTNRNSVNGVQLNNPQRSNVEWIEVFDLSGFGVKIVNAWDCNFGTITTEACGNVSTYSYYFTDDKDTGNMSHTHRLQVEKAYEKAIYISGNSLSCTWTNIHSEQALVTKSNTYTWDMGGGSIDFRNVRLHATTSGSASSINAHCVFRGAFVSVYDARIESAISVDLDANGGGGPIAIFNGSFSGQIQTLGTGPVSFNHCTIAKVTGTTAAVEYNHCKITVLQVGFTPTVDNRLIARYCTIGTMSSVSKQSRAELIDCIVSAGTMAEGYTKLVNTRFSFSSSSLSSTAVELINSEIVGHLTISSAYLSLTGRSRVTGNLTIGANRAIIFDASSYVTGTVTGMGPPQSSTFSGGFFVGQRTWNPTQSPGGVEYWICTSAGISGAAGTWLAVIR